MTDIIQQKKDALRKHYENMTYGKAMRIKSTLNKKDALILVKRVNTAKGYKFI